MRVSSLSSLSPLLSLRIVHLQDMVFWAVPPPAHLKADPGPWLRCLLTPVSAGAPPLCCKRRTPCWTWQQPFRPLRASRWLLSAPAAAAGSSTASWVWRSWSAWPLPSWLGMWSPWPSLCKRGNPEHLRDTWKVNVCATMSVSQAKYKCSTPNATFDNNANQG